MRMRGREWRPDPGIEGWTVGMLEGATSFQLSNSPTFQRSCPHRRWFSHPSPNRFRNYPHLPHQLRELIREERLRAVRQRLFGIRMDFDDDAVGAGRDRGT